MVGITVYTIKFVTNYKNKTIRLFLFVLFSCLFETCVLFVFCAASRRKKHMGDYYRLNSPWYYVIQVFTIFYALSTLANLVLVLNMHVTETAFPGTAVNEYYSQQYTSLQWWALFFCGAHVLMFPWVMMMITFRRSHGCSVFWFALIFMLVVGDAYSFIVLTGSFIRCNQVDQRDNLCNDKRWCCAPDVNGHASNACPVTPGATCADYPGITSHADLSPGGWFVALWTVNLLYFLADIAVVAFFLGIFCISPFPEKRSAAPRRGAAPSAPPLDKDDDESGTLVPPAPKNETQSMSHRIQSSLKYTKPE